MYVFDRTYSTLFDKDVYFLGSPIGFVDKCNFLVFSISRDILNRDIQSSINTFNRKCIEVRLYFSILNSLDGYLNMKIQVYYNTIHSYYIYILF